MNLGILSIDHFYNDPDLIRARALQMSFTGQARNLPALRSVQTLIPSEAKSAFSSLLKVDLDKEAKRIGVNGCFQLMLKSDLRSSYVHVDRAAQWAGLVYLSPMTKPKGGTSFYRHRLTSLLQMPEEGAWPSVAKSFGLSAAELKLLLKADARHPKKWEETDRVEFRYNRFILYDSKQFHRNGTTWGNSLQTGRLTHCFFV